MQLRLQRGWLLWMMAVLCAFPAQAAERVTLRSGFNVICDHQRPLNGAVRLFLTRTDDNYVDVLPGDIVREEAVPDATLKIIPDREPLVPGAVSSAPQKTVALPVILAQESAAHHIDVDLLASVIRAESNGNSRAISRAGAQGLMQLMPGTASALGVRDSFAPDQNVAAGTAYLDWLLTRYHDDPALALAAYNAGPEAVDKYHGIPPYAETRLYVARVIHDFNRRKRQLTHTPSQHAILGSD